MSNNKAILLLAGACLGSLAMVPAAALAQATDTESQDTPLSSKKARPTDAASDGSQSKAEDDDVVVTGTRIFNPNIKAAAPIQTITAQDIKLSGLTNIDDVLNRMPQIVPFNTPADQEGNGDGRVQLRYLGGGLVLLDGQRLAAGINSVPTPLIERVDILTGGAASTYGPDALSGVINFVLKKNYEGVQIDANYGFFNHVNRRNVATDTADRYGFSYPTGVTNDGARGQITVSAGHRMFDDRLSLSGYFSYNHTDPLFFKDRSINACHLLLSQPDAQPGCDTTLYSRYGYVVPGGGANSGQRFVNAADGTRAFSPYINALSAPTSRENRMMDSYQMQRQNQRYNAGGFLSLRAADFAEIYGSFMYTDNKSQGTYAPTTIDDGADVNCDNPLLSAQQAQIICGAAAGSSQMVPITFGYRFNNYPTRTIDYRQYSKRATLGVRGDFADAWHYDVGGVMARGISKSFINRNWTWDSDRVARALNVVNVAGVPTCVARVNGTDPACVPLDVFSGGSDDPATYQYIFQDGPNGPTRNASKFFDVVASVSGDLGHYGIHSPLATNGVQIALNVEYRQDSFVSVTSADYNSIIQGTATNEATIIAGRQNAREIAGELQVPLVEDRWWTKVLGLSGGYRLSRYSNNTRRNFGTWKIEGNWAPVRDMTFRVSRNFTSRAPSSFESSPDTNFVKTTGFSDPCGPSKAFAIEACRQTVNWQDSFYGSPALDCPAQECVIRNGNSANLGPQEAKTLTYGLVFTPRFLPRLTFSADRYKIQYVNQIITSDANDFASACRQYAFNPNAFGQFACRHFIRNADGTLFGSTDNPSTGFVTGDTYNAPSQLATEGWDFQGHYDVPVASVGSLNLDFNGSRTLNSGGIPGLSQGRVGYFGYSVGDPQPKWRHNLRTAFNDRNGVFQLSINWRYIAGTKSSINDFQALNGRPITRDFPDFVGPQKTFAKIDPYTYIDLSATIHVARRLTLGIIVNNLMDKDPPLIPAFGGNNAYSINGYQNAPTAYYDIYGRFVQFSISTKL
jgi:outer membrane receptor protein involved in Fe transport